MASDAKKLQPIIVKKIKKAGHAAHGGAWKIAYADFVTAMMAFFLLMWLLGSTTEGDRKGLADYFSSPLKISLTGGPGSGSTPSILPGGGTDLAHQVGQTRKTDAVDPVRRRRNMEVMRAEVARQDAQRLAALSARISAAISNNPKLAKFSAQIRLETTPDGLQIQIVDDQGRPMFDSGSAVVKPHMRDILREIGAALVGVENRISLDGHTDQAPFGRGDKLNYSNWELSADRANASRRELVQSGLPDDKLVRVTGLASSVLLEPENPLAPANRRISIMVLTREAEERLLGFGRQAVLAEPEAETATPVPVTAPLPPSPSPTPSVPP